MSPVNRRALLSTLATVLVGGCLERSRAETDDTDYLEAYSGVLEHVEGSIGEEMNSSVDIVEHTAVETGNRVRPLGIAGLVRHDTGETRPLEIEVDFIDADGYVFDSRLVEIPGVEPEREVRFEVLSTSAAGMLAEYEITATPA